jgi:glycosyltransferase involved in cell wall biosynthesis
MSRDRAAAETPLVSILTPTYNHETFIRSCMESVLQQTYANWEQIIVDDGSTDHTAEVVASFHDSRIQYHRQQNQGPFQLAKTYNHALSFARGEFIAILEGDDFWPAAKLAAEVPAFRKPEVVLAYGERDDVDERGTRQRKKTDTNRSRAALPRAVLFNDPPGAATRHMLTAEGRSLIGPCTAMIRRTALEKIGGFQAVDNLPLTDYPTFLALSLTGQFHYSPETLGSLRRHAASVTACHARTIHDEVSQFTRDFIKKKTDFIHLSPQEEVMLEKNWSEAGRRLHFSEGRMLLVRRKWSEARSHFLIASRSQSAKIRTAAVTALCLSFAHLNIEPIMAIGGRSDMRPTATSKLRS